MSVSSSATAALLSSLDRVAGRAARGAMAAAVVSGLLSVAGAWVLAGLVDAIVFHGADLAGLAPRLGLFAAVAILKAVVGWGGERAGFEAAAAVRRDLVRRLFDQVAAIGPVRLADRPIGDLAATMTEAVDAVAPLWRAWKPAAARAVAVPLAVLVVVLPADPIAAAILVVALPLLVWFSILAGKGAEEASGRQWASLARLGGHLLDQIRGLPETKLAGTSGRAIAAVKASAEAYGRETMAVLRIVFLSALVSEFVATGAIAGVAVAVGFRLMWGSLDFFTGFFVLLLAPEFFAPLREIGVRRHARIEATAALDTIAEVLGEPAATEPTGGMPAPHAAPEIRFEDVGVVHADGRVALDGLDLTLGAGETVALVGPSGAGKSTVSALLARFITPTRGRILVDGVPLEAIDLLAWRRALVHVPQKPAFFEGTVGANVVMGRGAPEDRAADLARALARAGATEVVARLPEGVDTPLGEGGRDLSGGEAQRLALARAFFAAGPIGLFDEPTAHLDAASEAVVTAALADLAEGRTVLSIAHRLETLAAVDRVVVLEAGRVVAEGPPATMLPRLAAVREEEGGDA